MNLSPLGYNSERSSDELSFDSLTKSIKTATSVVNLQANYIASCLTTSFSIGTPSQSFTVLWDTGFRLNAHLGVKLN
jgi:hypothetical protein